MTSAKVASSIKKNTKMESGSAKAKTVKADAIRLLIEDHREAKALFAAYESAEGDHDKKALADEICTGLSVHMQIEEEIFYPAARAAIDDDKLFDEASVEHTSCKQLVAEIQDMEPSDPLFDAKIKVLGEYISHHVEEEEKEMFPKSRISDLDLEALAEFLTERKATLIAQAEL